MNSSKRELIKLDVKKLYIKSVVFEAHHFHEVEDYLCDVFEELCQVRIPKQFDRKDTRVGRVIFCGFAWSGLMSLWMSFLGYDKQKCEEILNKIEIL